MAADSRLSLKDFDCAKHVAYFKQHAKSLAGGSVLRRQLSLPSVQLSSVALGGCVATVLVSSLECSL